MMSRRGFFGLLTGAPIAALMRPAICSVAIGVDLGGLDDATEVAVVDGGRVGARHMVLAYRSWLQSGHHTPPFSSGQAGEGGMMALRDGYLEGPFKGGHNDLSRWKRFGGNLERPAPPAPMTTPTIPARSPAPDS